MILMLQVLLLLRGAYPKLWIERDITDFEQDISDFEFQLVCTRDNNVA